MRKFMVFLAASLFFSLAAFAQTKIVGTATIGGKATIGGGSVSGPSIVKTGGSGVGVSTCILTTTTCAVTYTPSSSGDWAVVGIAYWSGATPHAVTSVTDNGTSGGSTYNQVTGTATVNSAQITFTLYCTTSLATSVTTITANGGGIGVFIVEGSGGSAPCTVDQSNLTANVTGPGTTWSSSATSATTNANDVAFGMSFDTTTQNPGWAGTSGYTAITGTYEAIDGYGFTTAYKSLSATAAQTATGTITGPSDTCSTVIWVLK